MMYSAEDSRVIRRVAGGVLAGLFLAICGGGAWAWHRSRVRDRNALAYTAFVGELERFDAAKQDPLVTGEQWKQVGESILKVMDDHRNTSLEPYFRAMYAEAAWRAGDQGGAREMLAMAIDMMGHVPVMKSVHTLAYAQLLLESDQAEGREQGKKLLLEYAQNNQAELQGVAWYQLHHYAVVHHDAGLREMAEARLRGFPRWQQLVKLHAGELEERRS